MPSGKVIEALNSDRLAWQAFCEIDRTAWGGQTRHTPSGRDIRIIVVRDQSFSNGDFSEYLFEGLDFKNVTFDQCDFSNANIRYSNFNNCTFNNCSFEKAEFEHSSINPTKAGNTNFSHTFFGKTSSIGGTFKKCNFKSIRIRESSIGGSSFCECNLKDAKFGRSDLTHAIWTKCLIDQSTDFEFSNLSSTTITKDTSETTRYPSPFRKHYFNWRFVRAIGNFPILGFS